MATLMIPGSKLPGIWGRTRCFGAGLIVYGTGALLAALGGLVIAMLLPRQPTATPTAAPTRQRAGS